MDIVTGSAILREQTMQISNLVSNFTIIVDQIYGIANQKEILDPETRIKALIASVDVQLAAIESQKVLIQQAADNLAKITQ